MATLIKDSDVGSWATAKSKRLLCLKTMGHHSAARPQMSRYAVTWSMSPVLNAGGVFLLSLLPGIDYRAAWLITRALVFFGWNHPMQRDYVFAPSEEGQSS